MKSVWIIEGLACCGGEGDIIEGFVETKQEANDIIAKLNNKTASEVKLWNNHCIDCPVMCNNFKSKQEAAIELEKIRDEVTCNCQQLEISEECPGDFYVICKRQPVQTNLDYTYVARKISKISQEQYK